MKFNDNSREYREKIMEREEDCEQFEESGCLPMAIFGLSVFASMLLGMILFFTVIL